MRAEVRDDLGQSDLDRTIGPEHQRIELRGHFGAGRGLEALVYWPDGSVKVALTQIVANLGTQADYRVAYGPNVSRAALPKSIGVTGTTATGFTVDTGLVQFAVSTKGVVNKVSRDLDGNGLFAAGEQVVDGGEFFLVNAKDNLEYTASAATDAVLTLEESGPVRVVVKATGTLTASGGSNPIKYLVRYYASQGSDKIDVEATIIDDRKEDNVQVLSLIHI